MRNLTFWRLLIENIGKATQSIFFFQLIQQNTTEKTESFDKEL